MHANIFGYVTQNQGLQLCDSMVKKVSLESDNAFRHPEDGSLPLVDAFYQPGC
jgi:hypothetical protein